MSYGFRLFSFKVVKGVQGSTPLAFQSLGPASDLHAADHMVRLLGILEGYTTLSTMPMLRPAAGEELPAIESYVIPDEELEHGDPKIRWLENEMTPGRRLSVTFRYGTVGRQPIAMASSGPDTDIRGKAPAQNFRADFYFPASGTVGILALESIDRVNAIKVVSQWLSRAAIAARDEDHAVEPSTAAVYKFGFNPLPDYPKLKSMIGNSKSSVIRLKKHTVTGEGTNQTEIVKVEAEVKLTEVSEQQSAYEWATKIFESKAKKFLKSKEKAESQDKVEAAELMDSVPGEAPPPAVGKGLEQINVEAAAVAEPDVEMTDQAAVAELENIVESVSGIGFDDGVLVLKDETGVKTKIGPKHLDDVFVYRITEEIHPDEVQWRQAVEREIVGLRAALKTEIELGEA